MEKFIIKEDKLGNRLSFSNITDSSVYGVQHDSVGVKYVFKGTEQYFMDKERFELSEEKFMVVNANHKWDGLIQEKSKPALGMCFNLSNALLSDVYNNFLKQPENLLEKFDEEHCLFFVEKVFSAHENALGNYLSQKAVSSMVHQQINDLSTFFYEAATHLVTSQFAIKKQLKNIKASKKSTQLELYKRVSYAREILEASIDSSIDIRHIAAHAHLSEFHFLRTFKEVYGITPYQYFLNKKLEKAAQLLSRQRGSITDVAITMGFEDIQTFSRSFKQRYKMSPLHWQQNFV